MRGDCCSIYSVSRLSGFALRWEGYCIFRSIALIRRSSSPAVIKPLNKEEIVNAAEKTKLVVTVEEHSVYGGLGGIVAEILAVTIRTRKGRLCQINTTRRAAYGYDQRFEVLGSAGMLQAGNPRPTEVTVSTKRSVSTDIPEPLFFERYRVAFAAEMKYFFDAVGSGRRMRRKIGETLGLELTRAGDPLHKTLHRQSERLAKLATNDPGSEERIQFLTLLQRVRTRLENPL
jgi:hypothetical protein